MKGSGYEFGSGNYECGFDFDDDHDGHSEYMATGIMNGDYPRPEEGTLDDWLQSANPDIVLWHLGTYDLWERVAAVQIIQAFDFILNKVRGKNPNVYVLVMEIVPMGPPECLACTEWAEGFNAQVVQWAQRVNTAASPVVSVDCYTGLDLDVDTEDGMLLIESGAEKVCQALLLPLEAALQKFAC
jgi:hypothetical protein